MAETNSPTLTSGEATSPDNVAQDSVHQSGSSGKPEREDAGSGSNKDIAIKPASKPVTTSPTAPAVPTFPPPKTDKPRPHVCTTCMRSFARLEHLKRHERSHTKEKPFECPSCTRCFARRDLLLRHQQKLHSTTAPSSRPRNARRESAAGVANGRVRKNSVASSTTAPMRPRANTLSHIESSNLGMLSSGAYARQFMGMQNQHNNFSGMTINPAFGFRGIGSNIHSAAAGLPRLETAGLPVDSGGLRTAPVFGGFNAEFEIGGHGFDAGNGNTINPHALHMHGMQGLSIDGSFDLGHHMGNGPPQPMVEDDNFDWMAPGFDHQMTFNHANEHAIDDSSPSVMSTNSPTGFTEATAQNAHNVFMDNGASMMPSIWQPSVSNVSHVISSPVSMDVSSFFGDVSQPTTETISPKSLLAQKGSNFEMNFPTPPDLSTMDPSALAAMSGSTFTLPFKHEHIASTASSASVDSTNRQSSVTTTSSELVSDQMRNALISGLAQNSGFGQRKQSQPAINSPLSPSTNQKVKGPNAAAFPATKDLQRYVAAYLLYFHPHLPFLHIATLNFESNEYSWAKRSSNGLTSVSPGMAGGGSCLLLSVAAMGALFENEMSHSRDLFECAKRLISTHLEERRRSNMARGSFAPYHRSEREDTPLWLVQAMLLNVIYGHNSGDKTTADIASNHCAALVSLARGAELAKPYLAYPSPSGMSDPLQTQNMHNTSISPDGWNMLNIDTSDSDWYEWKVMEERKRTLYAIFVLSSLLVTAYNRAPALTNSEIRLDLPCDEELWSAESAQAWRALGGIAATESRSVQFAAALTHLLTAAQRQRRATTLPNNGEIWKNEEFELRPSSFGCLILINALHNYIWETRQRHLGRQWTSQEIDSMHAHIEPALRAWQAAWRCNPTHAVERPNPFGAGPLSADSIPLLDLAYVRLFIDFGRSKEAYWQRDYDAMAQELAKGSENHSSLDLQFHNGLQSPPLENDGGSQGKPSDNHTKGTTPDKLKRGESSDPASAQPSPRERQLRKAAFYAADHLIASDQLGLGLDERNARELPMQSILCACDSAQVLAEWVATVQERVGRYVGIIGRDRVDLMQVPAVLLLDDEDRKLLSMIDSLLNSVESKRDYGNALIEAREGGYGSRILIVTSHTMTQAAVWPVTKLMAHSLETQAGHIKARALASVPAMSP